MTYIPEDLAISMSVLLSNVSIFQATLSGRNPPPLCIPVPQLPAITICVKIHNVHLENNYLFVCINLELQLQGISIIDFAFDCLKVGPEGITVVKPDQITNSNKTTGFDFNFSQLLATVMNKNTTGGDQLQLPNTNQTSDFNISQVMNKNISEGANNEIMGINLLNITQEVENNSSGVDNNEMFGINSLNNEEDEINSTTEENNDKIIVNTFKFAEDETNTTGIENNKTIVINSFNLTQENENGAFVNIELSSNLTSDVTVTENTRFSGDVNINPTTDVIESKVKTRSTVNDVSSQSNPPTLRELWLRFKDVFLRTINA